MHVAIIVLVVLLLMVFLPALIWRQSKSNFVRGTTPYLHGVQGLSHYDSSIKPLQYKTSETSLVYNPYRL